jgi:hypothetical protein
MARLWEIQTETLPKRRRVEADQQGKATSMLDLPPNICRRRAHY